MKRVILIVTVVAALTLLWAVPAAAAPGKPFFGSALWADGQTWGTKVTNSIPTPNQHNMQSLDKLFIFLNGPNNTGGAVGEAAPRNPNYNGGRWWTWTANWTNPCAMRLLKSYSMDYVCNPMDSVEWQVDNGNLEIWAGSPDFHPDYFHCPMLPDKSA